MGLSVLVLDILILNVTILDITTLDNTNITVLGADAPDVATLDIMLGVVIFHVAVVTTAALALADSLTG